MPKDSTKTKPDELSWKDVSGRNPLTYDEFFELATTIGLNIEAETARNLLLLCHALTYETSPAQRECLLQKVKEATAYLFHAFDEMVRGEILDSLPALRSPVE